ncbi:uncharacterized protein B0J16DRAFT_375082 [Fusarium flagelliforme]|uniref:Uncharacterized protein n=1 Tax=Fusarium flagelliforme TaxID=2675880 RepID=A0A395MAJ4_9HYPO|nr:uncharacterized protein B0J16DRAFT_375082 [Fusarium flagelliforme]KAH7174170.1 hypothetical protein B0J16DRAFT_375082 [Fusarium flagelliforme]RFN44932.1 hypothetical protein FIE12Z_10827 [Fusarium flagelliforme]
MTTIQSESSKTSRQVITRQVIKLLIAISLLSIVFGLILPTKLLRLLPVISSIVSLQFAYDEYFFLSCWTKREYQVQANQLLPRRFANWTPAGTKVVFGSFTLSLASGMANVATVWNDSGDLITVLSYLAGTLFAAGHLLIFGPTAIKLLAKIRRNDANSPSTESLELWLKMHATRSFVVDSPAVLCFIIGLLNAT